MKYFTLFLLSIFLIISCEKDSFEIKGEPSNLMTIDNPSIFSKTVILFENNSYLVKTPLDSFIIGHPFNLHDGYYNSYKDDAVNDSRIQDVLFVNDYMPDKQDTIYTLAYHLENGSCYMWDKKAEKCIKTIYVEKYMEGGPMTSRGGRRFYIRDQLFFTTVDMISK